MAISQTMNDPVFASFVLCVPPIVSLSKELVYAPFPLSPHFSFFSSLSFFVLAGVALIPNTSLIFYVRILIMQGRADLANQQDERQRPDSRG
jgi:hypothetical protein